MSRIQSLQTNSYGANYALNKKKKNNVDFTGGFDAKTDTMILNAVKEDSTNTFGRHKAKLIKYLNDKDGEIQNQVINAIFTTTLAPLFIACNPFSNQDKKTKEYTALRQPISAGIAISGGLAMTMGINNFMDTLGSEGHIKSIDLRMCPQDDYLEHKFKGIYKEACKSEETKKAFLEKYKPADYKGKLEELSTKDLKKSFVENVQKERKELFASLLAESPENLSFNKEKKQILLKTVDEKGSEITKVLGENIPGFETAEDLEKHLNNNNLYKIELKEHMKKAFKFNFYEDGKIKPYSIDKDLSSVNAMDFLRSLGLVNEKFTETELIRVLLTNRQPKVIAKIAKVFKTEDKDAISTLITEMAKQDARCGQLLQGEKNLLVEKISLKQMLDMLHGNIEGDAAKESLQNTFDTKVSEEIRKFAKLFKDNEAKGFNDIKLDKEELAKAIKKFGIKMTENTIKRSKLDFKHNKSFTGIFFNLFTTAITCTILNWIYPRAMKKFFPNLVKSDKAKTPQESQQVKGGK